MELDLIVLIGIVFLSGTFYILLGLHLIDNSPVQVVHKVDQWASTMTEFYLIVLLWLVILPAAYVAASRR